MKKPEHEVGGRVLAAECEAFLNGMLAEYWDEKGLFVPVWAWTNLLAHGGERLLADTVARRTRLRKLARRWRIARSYLAYEVLEVTDDASPLSELQSDVLIPLELELAVCPQVSRWGPRQWVDTVDDAIRNHHWTFPLSGTD